MSPRRRIMVSRDRRHHDAAPEGSTITVTIWRGIRCERDGSGDPRSMVGRIEKRVQEPGVGTRGPGGRNGLVDATLGTAPQPSA